MSAALLPFWVFAVAATLLLAVHGTSIALPAAYGDAQSATILGLGAALAGVLGAWRGSRAPVPAPRLATALAIASVLVSVSGYAAWYGFPRGVALLLATAACAGGTAFFAGYAAALGVAAQGRALVELGVLAALLSPVRGALCAGLFLAMLAVLPRLGLLRTGATLGAALASLSLLVPSVHRFLDLPAKARSRGAHAVAGATLTERSAQGASLLAAAVALVAFTAAEGFVTLAHIERHAGDVLYVAEGPRGRHVFTRLQGAVNLHSNDVLTLSGTDGRRFAEALVLPALSVTSAPERVLVLGDGSGVLEREVLRFPGVKRVTTVFPDRRLSELAEGSALLRPLGADALADRRLTRVEREPALFVTETDAVFDVVIADFGDPTSHRVGKHYTRGFLACLRKRVAPGGYLALQLTSPLRTPRAHASIAATLRAAGFAVTEYRAPLPTLGEWGFALARNGPAADLAERLRAARLPSTTALVTHQTLPDLFAAAAAPREPDAPTNFLYAQPVVELYLEEEHARWE